MIENQLPYLLVQLDSAESTNTVARTLAAEAQNTQPLLVVTDNQTAGRGQRGNSWESQPGANLTFSLVLFPRFLAPAHQFELSMLVSIGIVNALRNFVDAPKWLSIKWPNDIYFGDRKLAGILIENSLSASAIDFSVVGTGINVNQREFVSDAPNPISLIHTTGIEMDRQAILNAVVEAVIDMVDDYSDDPEAGELTALYNNLLWRNDGEPHTWHDTATDADFTATIAGVEPDGRLLLALPGGQVRSYLFKEVSAVL